MKLFQFSNDIENIFIQSNVVTINFKNMGTAVTDFEKLIEDPLSFLWNWRKNFDSWGHRCLWFYW